MSAPEASPQHTPGPWRFDDVTGEVLSDAPVADGDRSLEVGYAGYLVAETVARCNGPVLAAAPDLLAALKAAYRFEGAVAGHAQWAQDFQPDWWILARQAIDKAEGRQS